MSAPDFSRAHSERLRELACKTEETLPLPTHKLLPLSDGLDGVVLVACGSFSPITYLHLRMMEQARDACVSAGMRVAGGFYSPVTDAYKKKGLASSSHRVAMCELAVKSSDWLMIDRWESQQSEYQTSVVVLDHFERCLNKNKKQGDGSYRVRLVCGADLLESFNTPGVWAAEDIHDILTRFGLCVIERAGVDARTIVFNNDIMYNNQKHVLIVSQWVPNEISSTRVRQLVSRGLSIKYLTNDDVVLYIAANHLYQ